MKKIVIFLVCSVFLYGAGLQVATPKMDLKEFKNAKELKFVATKPAQFTINVPVDLDVIKGKTKGSQTASGSYELWCTIISSSDESIKYIVRKDIQPGQQTVAFKFNEISENIALKIDKYYVTLTVKLKGTTSSTLAPGFGDPVSSRTQIHTTTIE